MTSRTKAEPPWWCSSNSKTTEAVVTLPFGLVSVQTSQLSTGGRRPHSVTQSDSILWCKSDQQTHLCYKRTCSTVSVSPLISVAIRSQLHPPVREFRTLQRQGVGLRVQQIWNIPEHLLNHSSCVQQFHKLPGAISQGVLGIWSSDTLVWVTQLVMISLQLVSKCCATPWMTPLDPQVFLSLFCGSEDVLCVSSSVHPSYSQVLERLMDKTGVCSLCSPLQ